MEWKRDKKDYWMFFKEETFNGSVYRIEMHVYEYTKSTKYWVALSSGKKRKERQIFEDKDSKSTGGIKALIWAKNEVLGFPDFYSKNKKWISDNPQYILIHWADARRRDIYQRLQKEGFQFTMDEGVKLLRKKL